MSIIDKIKSYYPFPIAKLHEEMRLETESRARMGKLLNLFEGTSQYLALIGLSIYIHQNLSDIEVEKTRLGLARPSLGIWIGLLRSLSKCLSTKDTGFLTTNPKHEYKNEPIGVAIKIVRDVVGLGQSSNMRLQGFLDTMVEFRNKKKGHGDLSLIEADKLLVYLEEAVNQWLDELTILYERNLLYISDVKLQKKKRVYFGTQLNTGASLESFQSEGEVDLDDKCVYLYIPASRVYVLLSPFLFYNPSIQVLYMYQGLIDQNEARLRRPYNAYGTDELMKMPVDKILILGSSSGTNPADSEPMPHSTIMATEISKETIESLPFSKSPNKENITNNQADNTKKEFNINTPLTNTNDIGNTQILSERELIQRKRDSLQKTWDSLQERIEGLRQDLIHETRREEQHRINSEIKKALTLQAEIEPELNELISNLSKIEESHSQRAINKSIHQIDAERSGQGLFALSQLMKEHQVFAVMIRSREHFVNAHEKIDLLRDYKNIHDALHELEFTCFTQISKEAARFPGKSNFDDLNYYRLILINTKDRIQETIKRGYIYQNDRLLLERLDEAEKALGRALKTRDRKIFDEAVRRIGHILSHHLAGINRDLSHAASSLQLPDLIEGMKGVKDKLKNHKIDGIEMDVIESGVQSLQNLSDSLQTIAKEHNNWQDINDELRFAEHNMQLAVDQWVDNDNKKRLDKLCDNSKDALEIQIKDLCEDLDKAIKERASPKKVLELFKSCNRLVGLRFYQIDVYLKDLCDQIKNLDEPITSIVNQMI